MPTLRPFAPLQGDNEGIDWILAYARMTGGRIDVLHKVMLMQINKAED